MDIFCQLSDTFSHSCGSYFQSLDIPETPTKSDAGFRRVTCPNEEVLLASSNPKKRAGRKKFQETRHPVFRGVRKRNVNKWVCEVREPIKQSRIWLGTFPTAEMAARAHDVAAFAFRGRSACLNFADSAWRLPTPASSDPKDIQKAAGEAAEAFRPDARRLERVTQSKENVFYRDEEAELDIPGMLANMAQGMLLSPPHPGSYWDDIESDADVTLWSYNI